jgi:hypothetical protein
LVPIALEEGGKPVIVRTVFGFVAALAFAGVIGSASTADAKACAALCRDRIKACKALCVEKPKAKCKRACKTDAVADCKLTSTTPKERTCPASPSGAFLE